MLALCVLFTLPSFAQTGGVAWEHGTFAEALNKAKANKKGPKLVFMDCYTTWCGPCKYMANNVFPTKEAGDYFNKNFVNIKIDMEKGEGKDIAKKYGVVAYPTFLILNFDGSEIGRILGSNELNTFIRRVENAKDIKNSPKTLKEAFNVNKNYDNALAYLKSLGEAYMKKDIDSFLTENISIFNKGKLFSPEIWKHVYYNISTNDVLLQYVLDNKTEANSILGTDKTNSAVVTAFGNKLKSYLSGKIVLNKEEVSKAVSYINLLATPNDKVIVSCAKIAELYSNGKMEEIVKFYNFSNFTNLSVFEVQSIERVFASIKEITKEQITEYYNGKEDFYTKQVTACKAWRDTSIKAKEPKETK